MGRLLSSLLFSLGFIVNCLSANQAQPVSSNIESSVIAEAEPNSFVNKSVNVIYGSFYHTSLDLSMPGPEPLHFCRYYNSQNTTSLTWLAHGMSSNYPVWIGGLPFADAKYAEMVAEEDGGSVVKYIARFNKNEMDFYLHPQIVHEGFTNGGSSEISARTNLKNNRYTYEAEEKHGAMYSGIWRARLASGGVRRYRKAYNFEERLNLKYEEKPNGNKLFYEHNSEGVTKIEAKDAKEKHTLGWLKFDTDRDTLTITSSNNKEVKYKFFKRWNEHGEKARYIEKVSSTDFPTTYYDYVSLDDHRRYVSRISWPEGRFLEVEYDKHGRVEAQKAPIGREGEKHSIYRFEYRPHEWHTIVHDAHNRKSVFRYSSKKRLTMVEKYGAHDRGLMRGEHFYWGDREHISRGEQDSSDEGHLLAKAIFIGDDQNISSIHYSYDDYGNILKEDFYGNLTGKQPNPFSIASDGKPKSTDIERYRKTYTYSDDSYHLKLSQSEDAGPTIKYGYEKHTDLLTSKLTLEGDQIKIREFFEYDDAAVLIKKIIDDGSSSSSHDARGITERRITTIIPVRGKTSHGLGQPATIIDSYFDLKSSKEITLKRRDFEYNETGLVTKEEVREASDALYYTLYFSYDNMGRLVQKTDPLGRTYSYAYDANSNKIREELHNSGFYTTYEYDKANRLIKETEHHKNGLTFSTSHIYNLVSNRISSTDHFGNTTYYEYDDLNRLIKTTYPEVRGPKEQPCSPASSQEYDALDNITTETDENGHSTSYHYTIRKQPFKITYADNSTEKFEYNLNGTLAHKGIKVARELLIVMTFYEEWSQLKFLILTTSSSLALQITIMPFIYARVPMLWAIRLIITTMVPEDSLKNIKKLTTALEK